MSFSEFSKLDFLKIVFSASEILNMNSYGGAGLRVRHLAHRNKYLKFDAFTLHAIFDCLLFFTMQTFIFDSFWNSVNWSLLKQTI